MKPEEFLHTTLTDIKVKLAEEFDRNFERKAFFDKKWKQPKLYNSRGSVMMRTGKTRRSIQSNLTPAGVQFTSPMPHAEILNNGGEITVTEKMKRFFWAMHYKASGGAKGNGQKAKRLSIEAEQWKALALKKVGSKIKIEQRQYLGHHPQTDKMIREIINRNLKEIEIKPFKK
ncbi:phage virion morphogenesis protein [Riemerella anatipestifer]|uniref:phage virion morphogenesis protein n=1 Tax=Riemerella anatipestifer TaxID=34085 RepID=UPI0023640D8F|nr:phage virion morphogenesis protein [Riemerella anatipestifer]MDD1525564.1 hypothetical protein [Riemerella anatipestifer]